MRIKQLIKQTLFSLAIVGVLVGTATAGTRQASHQRSCPMNLPQQTVDGALGIGQVDPIREWSSTCTGALSESTSAGMLHLLRMERGAWVEVRSGISINMSSLPPGNYRLMINNHAGIRLNYSARFRFGIG